MVICRYAAGTETRYGGGSSPCDGEGAREEEDLFIRNGSRGFDATILGSVSERWGPPLCLEFPAQSFSFANPHRADATFIDHEEDFDRVCHFIQSAAQTFGALIPESI